MAIVNYEGKQPASEQLTAFREVLQSTWEESLKEPGIHEWNPKLLEITEGRRTIKNPDGSTRTFYSWCGDWVTYHLERAGCRHGLALNRQSLNTRWVPGMNLTYLRAWAGEPALHFGDLAKRFQSDVSAAFGPNEQKSWHPWDNEQDVCRDGYVPALGDLLVCPRKGGDHIEFFVKRDGNLVTVSAGAQLGGTALRRERNLDVTQLLGVIDISGLVTAEPF